MEGAPYEYTASHGAAAVELLLTQFRGKPKIEALLRSLVAPYNRIENALWQMVTRVIPLDSAEGGNLDLWGRILRAPRRGLTDDQYRVRLQVRMLALRSNGKIEEIYAILRAALGDTVSVTIYDAPPATLVVDIGEPLSSDAWTYEDTIVAAKAGGVRLVFVTNPAADAEVFTWDDGSGLDGATLGWGSAVTSTTGGVWASASVY